MHYDVYWVSAAIVCYEHILACVVCICEQVWATAYVRSSFPLALTMVVEVFKTTRV